MSDSNKILPEKGRSASPTAAAEEDPRADLFGEVAVDQARGPGRPAGALNKRSDDLRNLLAMRHGATPGELLGATLMGGMRRHLDDGGRLEDWMTARAIEVANELQCSSSYAMTLLLGVAKELMPYVHQKLPLLVDVESKAIVFAMIDDQGRMKQAGQGIVDVRPQDVRDASKNDDKSGPVGRIGSDDEGE